MDLPTQISECSLDVDGSVCSDTSLVIEIDKVLDINIAAVPIAQLNNDTAKQVIDVAKRLTNCDSEKCVLNSSAIQNKVNRDVLRKSQKRFKPSGPHNSTKLLSNFNIDNVLGNFVEIKKHHGFYHMNFQMMDFNGSDKWPPSELATVNICKDVIEGGYNCMGVVMNTDTRSGNGKHWFALFCDFRRSGGKSDPYTIEYFNSSGNPPQRPVHEWLVKTVECIGEYQFTSGAQKRHAVYVITSTLQHQKSQTECGPYSLYFIWSRLNKEPTSSFSNIIPDGKMMAFRKHLFA